LRRYSIGWPVRLNQQGSDVMADAYASITLEGSEDLVQYNRWVLSSISDAIRGRTLEVGAGIGTLSALVRPWCSELVLVEPAENLCASLSARFEVDSSVTACAGLLPELVEADPDLFKPGFDTIVSFNVLEHVEDDIGLLRVAAGLLRPGGQLCLFVPSGPALYGTQDALVNHLRRYTKKSLTVALRAAGLAPVRIRYFDLFGTIPWFIHGRVLRRTTTDASLGWYDRFVIPVCKVIDRLTGPPRGKNLVAVAEAVA
jgi:SAM-dependent methyltransferase